MNQPNDLSRLLALLADENKPELSPYFEARLRRRLAQEQRDPICDPKLPRLIRQGTVALLILSALLLWRFPYLHWLIALLVVICLPEDWAGAIFSRLRRRGERG